MLGAFEGMCVYCGHTHDAGRIPTGTTTNYPAALARAEARVAELEKLLAEQIQHTHRALCEAEGLVAPRVVVPNNSVQG